MIQLFIRLIVGDTFHFYDNPERKLLKLNSSQYLAPGTEGIKKISPYVAVFPDANMNKASKSIWEHQTKGVENVQS